MRFPLLHQSRSVSLSASRAATLLLTIAAAACSSNGDSTTSNGGAAASVIPWSGQDQVGTVGAAAPAPLQVRVVDAAGNSVIGAAVTLTTSAGTLGATSGVTADEGIFQTNFTLGTKSGTDTITVSVNGVTTPAVFVFTALAGAPAAVATVAGDNQSGHTGTALQSELAVLVKDQYGNPVPNAVVTWSATAGAPAFGSSVSDDTGVSKMLFNLGTSSGQEIVTAAVDANTKTTFTEVAN